MIGKHKKPIILAFWTYFDGLYKIFPSFLL